MTRRGGAPWIRREPSVPDSFAIFGAFAGSMILAILLGAATWIPGLAAAAVLCVFVCAWSLCSPVRGAAAAVICAALFSDGFVEDRYGTLAWHGAGDAEWLTALIAAALVGIIIRYVSMTTAAADQIDLDGGYVMTQFRDTAVRSRRSTPQL